MISSSIRTVYAVEVSGLCNMSETCSWCPMYSRPRNRVRALMDDDTVTLALKWVEKLEKTDVLALHVFGEPLIHPKFDEIAKEFSKLSRITMSTNAVFLDERWADRLAKCGFAYISLSPWDPKAADNAYKLLSQRGIRTIFPEGITHNWAGQAIGPYWARQAIGPKVKMFKGCPFLSQGKVVIRWSGDITSCCITDREEDVIGHVSQDIKEVSPRSYSICEGCHHNV